MAIDPKVVTRVLLGDLLDDRIRFHEVVWSLHTNQYPKESEDDLRAAAVAAALEAAAKGWVQVTACTDWEKQRYEPVPAPERETAIREPAHWSPEAPGPVSYWFDITAAGEEELLRRRD